MQRDYMTVVDMTSKCLTMLHSMKLQGEYTELLHSFGALRRCYTLLENGGAEDGYLPFGDDCWQIKRYAKMYVNCLEAHKQMLRDMSMIMNVLSLERKING